MYGFITLIMMISIVFSKKTKLVNYTVRELYIILNSFLNDFHKCIDLNMFENHYNYFYSYWLLYIIIE